MKAKAPKVRVEQWSAAQAQGRQALESPTGQTARTSITPSLLETLRAAAAAADEKVRL